MSEHLRRHIEKFTEINQEDFAGILAFFHPLELKKKENLLTEGKICRSNYFVVEGCLRMFFINDKGVEQTIQFAIENWWLADYASFEAQKPSEFYIQAVEKCEILAIDCQAQEEMLQAFPRMERYFRMVHQRAHAASQFRIRSLYDLSREELYYQFTKRHPEFVQRVPQYLLASFLGFTPEYLSEIRSKKLS
ncbi:Crp/Fnr family transcriptional regulator [Runella sp.]|uniref:Crp/Fnr family transcriptional regulator n=1 Tax=Runella sp. TaxID=1960881 RepID=UPI003D0E6A75